TSSNDWRPNENAVRQESDPVSRRFSGRRMAKSHRLALVFARARIGGSAHDTRRPAVVGANRVRVAQIVLQNGKGAALVYRRRRRNQMIVKRRWRYEPVQGR